jgi:hypothetical protein
MGSALTFLQYYWEEGEEFLHRISAETKEQSKQWIHMHYPNKPKKFKRKM